MYIRVRIYIVCLFLFNGCRVIVGHYGIYPCAASLQVPFKYLQGFSCSFYFLGMIAL